MKTISDLEKKKGYRLLKVFYGIIVIIVMIVMISDFELKQVNLNKTIVYCQYQDKKVLTLKNIGISLYPQDFIKGKFDYKYFFSNGNGSKIISIIQKCYIPRIDNYTDEFVLQRRYEIQGFKSENKAYSESYLKSELEKIGKYSLTNEEKVAYLDFSMKFFDINPVFDYVSWIKNLLLAILIIIVITIVLSRIVYYVVLWSFTPKK